MAQTELERAEKRLAQARARVQALRSREATKARKLDTRRKVILGGALVDLAARDDGARAMLDWIVRNLGRQQDRAAFDGWEPGADGGGGWSGEDRHDDPPGDGAHAPADRPREGGHGEPLSGLRLARPGDAP